MPNAGAVDTLLPLALSRPAEALARASQLLARDPDPHDASIAHQARAIVLRDHGRHGEATAALRTALRLARRSGSRSRVVDVQATLGATLGLGGRTRAGLAVLDEAVAGSTGVLAGRVLLRRASVLRELGRHADALADLRRAVTLLRRGGDAVWEARARSHLFIVRVVLGQVRHADRDLEVAARLFASTGQELESAMVVQSRAELAFQLGDLPSALGYLDEAAARYAALSHPVPDLVIDRCAVLLAAGLAAEALAVTDEAIRHHPGGVAIKRAELLFAAARAAQAAGQPVVAAQRAAAARDLFGRQRRPWWQARASFVLVQSRYSAGERGGRVATQAARLADRLDALGAPEALAAHLLAGRLASARGRVADADRHLALAARFRHRGPAFGRAVGWLAQALHAHARADTRATLIACRRGLDAAEEHLRMLAATELRAHATAYGTELAALAQRHAVRRGDARQLLWWSERWRASALAAPPARPPDDQALAAELAALRAVTRRLDAGEVTGPAAARLDQERARLEGAVRARTRRTTGGGTARTRRTTAGGMARARRTTAGGAAPVAGRSGVDEIVDRLGGYRLIEIVALDGVLYTVVADDRRVRLHTVGPVAEAVREVELARFMLRRLAYGRPPAGALAGLDAAGAQLQEVLLGSSVGDLDGRPVVVVPPGRLHAVPWSLLPALRDVPVRVAPSAATWLRACQARPPRHRRTALVVGPGLQGTLDEVTRIAQGYPGAVLLSGGRATAERTLAALDGATTAHIAAHGVFRADNPLFSALRLDDGPLTGYDLARLRRAPYRLVLSSCESGMAAHVGGDELLGLVNALVPLGTVSLLASVVPVNDQATAQFMVAFHEQLRLTDSFPDALCAAQAQALKGDDPVAVATARSFVALGR